MPEPEPFRWQALFQRVAEPLFLLDRQRRVRFANGAWQALTGLTAAEAHGLVCRRRREVEPGTAQAVGHTLAPPPEVMAGQPGRVRRLIVSQGSRHWWDVEFFPLRLGGGGCAVLGKVTAVVEAAPGGVAPLPEKLVALRERLVRRYTFDSLAGGSLPQRLVAEQARLASQSRVAVLLVGEPGTGKEWTARVIHYQGTARARSFAALDCARLPALVLAALFDDGGLLHRPGLGTVYLREVAALPRDLQARLADWLVDGNEAPGPRIIAGLSTDPAEEVQAGRLLADLCALLSTLIVRLPPLRERVADLPVVVPRLLERAGSEPGGRRITGLSPEAWKMVREYRWPGNLRELAEALVRAQGHAAHDLIEAADLPAHVRLAVQLEQEPGREKPRVLPLADLLQQVERRLLALALEMARGNKSQAAELLALSRGSLLNRLERLGMGDQE